MAVAIRQAKMMHPIHRAQVTVDPIHQAPVQEAAVTTIRPNKATKSIMIIMNIIPNHQKAIGRKNLNGKKIGYGK